jgi:hypothetical protein
MKNRLSLSLTVVWTLLLATAGAPSFVRAGHVTGTIALVDTNDPTTNTGNIQTATVFDLGAIVTTTASSGDFKLFVPASQPIGGTTVDVLVGTSIVLGTGSGLGQFSSVSITEIKDPAFRSITIDAVGSLLPGSDFPAGFSATPVKFDLSLTQAGGSGSSISASATISSVPEPSSALLLVVGVLLWRSALRRRNSR